MTTYTMAGPLPDQPDPDAELLIPNDALPELMKRRLRPANVYLMSLRLLVACQCSCRSTCTRTHPPAGCTG